MQGCTGKLVFRSPRHARLAHSKAGFRVRPYYCGACDGYHIANSDKRDCKTPPKHYRELPMERPPVTDVAKATSLFKAKGFRYEEDTTNRAS